MTAEQMWHAYCESSGVSEQTPYSAWAFCGGGAVGDELAQLVLDGTKTACITMQAQPVKKGRKERPFLI